MFHIPEITKCHEVFLNMILRSKIHVCWTNFMMNSCILRDPENQRRWKSPGIVLHVLFATCWSDCVHVLKSENVSQIFLKIHKKSENVTKLHYPCRIAQNSPSNCWKSRVLMLEKALRSVRIPGTLSIIGIAWFPEARSLNFDYHCWKLENHDSSEPNWHNSQ